MPHHIARSSVGAAVIVGAALTILAWHEAGTVRRTTSATYDEPVFVRMAFQVRGGDWSPLIEAGAAPLAVLLDALVLGPFQFADLKTDKLLTIVERTRIVHFATIGFPLMIAVYLWLLQRRGWIVAGCAALGLALSPTFIAHATLATSDAALAFWVVMTLAALTWHHQRPGPWRLLAVAVAMGFALGAKYSAVFLLPAVVVSVGFRRALAVVAGASLVVWALHGGVSVPVLEPEVHLAWLGDGPTYDRWLSVAKRVDLPAPLVGALHQWVHQRGGANAFFLALESQAGWWWWYFPVAIALKSTPAEWAAALTLPILFVWVWKRRDHAWTLWVIAMASFGTALLLSKVDIGVRYALPLYPLAVLAVADSIGRLALRRTVALLLAGVFLAAQAYSSFAVAPHYLAYFNEFVGGPAEGHRYLADSNLDWGQDLPALSEEIARLGHPRVCLAYFGKAAVEPYGVEASDWRDPEACRRAEWFAVSVTYLQVAYIDGHPFRLLLPEAPDHRAGFSIYLYDMRRPKVTALLESAWAAGLHGSR